tara:strand:+ start:323 stop:718 length:396 start_codon:yes stop_codon:yes gene_type:complete
LQALDVFKERPSLFPRRGVQYERTPNDDKTAKVRAAHKALRAAGYTQARLQTAHDTQDVYFARLTEGVRLWEEAGLYKVIDPLWACRICKPIFPEKKGFFDSLSSARSTPAGGWRWGSMTWLCCGRVVAAG